ncbi:UNVERIFIED_CONTAM: hypothetical protein GTU68_015271 [Idotea baltica]|nr:hypothetical protein [Idotea baltica]
MVINVAEKAVAAEIGDVYVACADEEIAEVCKKYGFECVVTDPDIKTGTDRVHATLNKLDKDYKYVVNLQGDLPSVSPESIKSVVLTFNIGLRNKSEVLKRW